MGGWRLFVFLTWRAACRKSSRRQALDRRTAVGIDTARRRLWLAVFERASDYAALRVLARHGAKEGMMLDGGHSTTMVLGPKAAGGKGGTLLGRLVAHGHVSGSASGRCETMKS